MAVTTSGKDKLTKHARIYCGGVDLSGDWKTIGTIRNGYEVADMLGVSEDCHHFAPSSGIDTGIDGFQSLMSDTAVTGAHTVLNSAPNTTQTSIVFGGGGDPASGDPAYHLPSLQLSDSNSLSGGSPILSTNFVYDKAQYTDNYLGGFGVCLRGPVSIAANVDGATGNSFDMGAASAATATWSAVIQVLATASGNYAFTLEDSSDGDSYSGITGGAFTTTGAAIGSELLSATGAVKQYVAFNAVKTAGTVTVVVTFVRST